MILRPSIQLNGNMLWVRADASQQIGIGHVVRCWALAQAWIDAGGKVRFLCHEISSTLRDWLVEDGIMVDEIHAKDLSLQLAEIRTLFEQTNLTDRPEWIVVDGYQFDLNFQNGIRQLPIKLLLLDDYANHPNYAADILLNQNQGSEHLFYWINSEVIILSGTKFALLRREFHNSDREFPKLSDPNESIKLFISLGGADSPNYTLKVLQALENSKYDLKIQAVIGPANPHRKILDIWSENTRHQLTLHNAEKSLYELMKQSDIAIITAGSICWELASLGKAMIVLVTAQNQEVVANGLVGKTAAMSLGNAVDLRNEVIQTAVDYLISDREMRQHLGIMAKLLIDGNGAQRVVEQMVYYTNEPSS